MKFLLLHIRFVYSNVSQDTWSDTHIYQEDWKG